MRNEPKVYATLDGECKPVVEWCKILKLNKATVFSRINRSKMVPEMALTYGGKVIGFKRNYGDWMVIGEPIKDRTRSRHNLVHCLCVCGRKKTLYLSNLQRGDSNGCGCSRTERYKKTRLYNPKNIPIFSKGYQALHGWVRRRLEKPKACQNCRKEKSLDLANKSQKYKRDLTDWLWLCRRCHMIQDGRMTPFVTKNGTRKLNATLNKAKEITGQV